MLIDEPLIDSSSLQSTLCMKFIFSVAKYGRQTHYMQTFATIVLFMIYHSCQKATSHCAWKCRIWTILIVDPLYSLFLRSAVEEAISAIAYHFPSADRSFQKMARNVKLSFRIFLWLVLSFQDYQPGLRHKQF